MSGDREDIINSIEEALKFVDDSDLPPAPASVRPLIERSGQVNSPVSQVVEENTLITPENKPKPNSIFSEMKQHRLKKKNTSFVIEDAENEEEYGSAGFKMKFDFESAYRDVPNNRPLRQRREKRTGLVGGLMFMVFILCIAVVFASIAWMATIDILGFASEDELVHVQVPNEFDLNDIIDLLYEANLIRYKALFRLYAEYSEAEAKISPGSYVLNRNYDYRALVQGMTARAGVRVEVSVTIPEGFTLSQIFRRLEDEGVCSAEDLWYTATHHDFNFYFLDNTTLGNRLRLEGFLFPDTYNFFLDSTPTQVISRMLREFDRRFTEQYIERATHLGYTVREIVIIASMIEREAGNDEERSRIAAVIYNRLNSPNFPRLEIDATIHYAIADTGIPFSISLDSPFNTYVHDGLPPGPIANPGIASIHAALYPDSTREFYYALNRNGTHNFFTNYTDHNNFVNSPEYGG
ncbi:MAG: endolytic transglycosylase MltG [Oscillospiraceae bacterium]|jgi:UPF0755 protein|nr:endolytic transglycosylase MltG [Oscillospiraceae bacterium]